MPAAWTVRALVSAVQCLLAQGARTAVSDELCLDVNLLTRIRSLWTIGPSEESELPDRARSVAIIMDGNGRWARRRGLPVAEGHRAGTKALRRAVEAAIDLDVESLAVYAFSTENWSRTRDEIDTLMEIFGETIDREFPDLVRQGVRVRFIGLRDRAPEDLQLVA